MAIKAVFFDLDGTLLDDGAAVRAGASALHTRTDCHKSPADFLIAWEAATERHFEGYVRGETGFQDQRRARVREVIDARLADRAADALYEVYREAYEAAWAPYDDVAACLDALASLPLALVTNGEGAQQRRKLERLGIADRFACVAISSEVGFRKPEAEIFLHVCCALAVDPAGAVHVGDSYASDAVGARMAGVGGVWLDRRNLRGPEHEPPMVSTLDEFSRLVSCLG